MSKPEIIDLIELEHDALISWLEAQEDDKWTLGPEGKWTTGEHVVHLIQSFRPLNKALRMPGFLLSYKFGTSNRETRSYDEVVQKYHTKLAQNPNVVSPLSRKMPDIKAKDKSKFMAQLTRENNRLVKNISRWSDKKLDKYVLPHPLMGRMPVREMLMWTAYHIKHHTDQLKKSY